MMARMTVVVKMLTLMSVGRHSPSRLFWRLRGEAVFPQRVLVVRGLTMRLLVMPRRLYDLEAWWWSSQEHF